jgi:hypothetical protein
VRRQLVGDRGGGTQTLWRSALPVALVGATVFLSGFWLLEEYAASVGRDLAGDVAASVDLLPRAVVTSSTPLGIEAPNVHEETTSVASEPSRYRTTGLRLLSRSGGKVLLVHDGWTPTLGTVIVLTDGDELVWEFFR